jgi:T5SS/PEP-CTERM-associated repeat protein
MRTTSQVLAWAQNSMADRPGRKMRSLVVVLTFLGMFALLGTAHAANATWVGPAAGGDFQNGANWNLPGGVPPAAGDLALIGTVNGTITYSASTPVLSGTFFTGTNVNTVLDIGAGKTHSTSGLVIVGSGGVNQDLEVISGTVQNGSILIIGSGLGSNNSDVTVSGPNTLYRTGSAVFVGTGGLAPTLTVKQGARFENTANNIIGVGLQQTDDGLLTVTDPGTHVSTLGALQVGSNNDPGNQDMTNNQAKILNGGRLTARVLQIGILTSGLQNTVTVSGPDSLMTLTGEGTDAWVGRDSINNTLIVENQGRIEGRNRFFVGQAATSSGNVSSILSGGRIDGTGFDVRRGSLTITDGTLSLTQFIGGAPPTPQGGALVANTGATGTIAFNSGLVEAVGADINNGSAFTVGNGGGASATYRMLKTTPGLNGTHSFANGLSLSSNAILSGNGNIVGNVSGAAGAQVNVGLSPGVINTTGAWNNTALQVGLEVGNLALVPAQPGEGYDLLDVVGAFTHGGAVNINVAGYAPGSGFVKDLKLVGWSSEVGSSASTAVSFVGGPALPYQFRADGLYLTNVAFTFIPEPATFVMFAIAMIVCITTRRRAT